MKHRNWYVSLSLFFCITVGWVYDIQAQSVDFYDQGEKLYRAKSYEKAAQYFDYVLKMKPDDVKAYYMKGKCKVELDQYNEALDNFTKASNLLPQESEYYYYKGLCEWKLKRVKSAIDNLEKSLTYDPNNFLSYKILGAVYLELNMKDKAKEFFDKAIEVQPDFEANVANKNKVDAYTEAYGVILRSLTRESKKQPDNPMAYFQMGLLKTIAQDNYGANNDFSKSMEVDPGFIMSLYYRGLVKYNMKKFKESLEDLFRYVQKNPNDAKASKLLEDVKAKMNINIVGDAETNEIFLITEEMPEFPGGNAELNKFVTQNIQYPREAMKLGIKGRVIVSFVIAADGSVKDTEVIKGIGGGTEMEAMRILSIMPKWTPGKHNGKPVSVKYTLPIKFSLAE